MRGEEKGEGQKENIETTSGDEGLAEKQLKKLEKSRRFKEEKIPTLLRSLTHT